MAKFITWQCTYCIFFGKNVCAYSDLELALFKNVCAYSDLELALFKNLVDNYQVIVP